MATTIDRGATATRRSQQQQEQRTNMLGAIVRYALLTAIAILAFMPFILSFLGTFKTNAELTTFPPRLLPDTFTSENWVRVWNFKLPQTGDTPVLPLWLWNSVLLALINVATQVFFCSLAGYAFARMRFPGKKLIYGFLIATMAIPVVITLIPGFVFFSRLPSFGFQGSGNWINTWLPLIVPSIVTPFGILMFTDFFRSIPKDLEEAAYMDGLERFGTYWRIVLPLSGPLLITFVILQFQASWNNFIAPVLFLQSADKMTLTVGMNFFRTQYSNDLSAILVAAMFNAIPVLILFFIFNKYYTQSNAYSGLAGQ